MGYIRYFGHAAFEVSVSGLRILVDPWLSNPLFKGSVNEAVGADLIVVTHDHDDHLGDAIEILRRSANTKLVAVYELASYVGEQVGSERVIGANVGGSVRTGVKDVELALTPAAHSSTRGTAVGVVIKSPEATVYHAGDTGLIGEMQLIGELYKPDYALLPIGGHFTMDVAEAVKAVELLKPKYVIPMHYNTFPVIEADPEEFKKEVEARGLAKVIVLAPGDKHEF